MLEQKLTKLIEFIRQSLSCIYKFCKVFDLTLKLQKESKCKILLLL